MENKKHTKRALFGSVIALILCCAMLIGTTFAWFTDEASTAVNSIQSGTLDVMLVDAADNSVEGQTLKFITADNREEILWEPGCTYNLPEVFIKNNGNLALKYKITVTGVDGDAKLLEAIDWIIKIGDQVIGADGLEWHLSAGQKSSAITISGHMKETAGNEYQNLTLNGIGITVAATQWTEEYDSATNQYDANAAFAEVIDLGGESVNWEQEEGVVFLKRTGAELVLTNGTLMAGDADNYAVILEGGNATIDAAVKSAGGGIGAVDGAKVTINSNVDVSTASTSGRYNVYAVSDGTEVTINGGEFTFSKTLNQKRAYIYAGAGATVYVNGGTFGPASTREGYTAGIKGDGTIIITGGTFGFDPSNWVAEGYQAVETDGTWTVSAK